VEEMLALEYLDLVSLLNLDKVKVDIKVQDLLETVEELHKVLVLTGFNRNVVDQIKTWMIKAIYNLKLFKLEG
jgi:hypothetical protein